ncbi:MAG: glycosyl transferase group 1 [Mucilaginibacter sp.]|nr:glycosyl transferase group 1 [Mucilaginibacter sp.]
MKKILVFSTQLMKTGGIESHLREFCTQISKSDVKIDLVILNSCILPLEEEYYNGICNFVHLGKNGRSNGRRLIWLFKIGLKLNRNRYDAVYTNGQGNSIGFFLKFLRLKGLWVHHHHTSGDESDQKEWSKGYIKALKQADKVIACSNRNAEDMKKALNKRIDAIPCFSRKITVNASGLNLSKIKFGYYGRLIPEKGIDILCQLSEDPDFKDVEFHIWGDGDLYPSEFFEQFLNINYHGTFTGLNGLTDAIASLDAFLLISVNPEGLPISLLEAMSAGLPWLATDKGGIPDIACDPNSTRIISSNSNYQEIKNAVKLFATDISKGNVSRVVQEKLYREKFSSSVLTKRWKTVLGIN